MRTLALLLVLGNLAFFAWWRYASPPDAGLDPLPLARQIEPEKLKIIPPAELAKLPAVKKPATAPQSAAPLAAATPAAGASACLEWGSFTLTDAFFTPQLNALTSTKLWIQPNVAAVCVTPLGSTM